MRRLIPGRHRVAALVVLVLLAPAVVFAENGGPPVTLEARLRALDSADTVEFFAALWALGSPEVAREIRERGEGGDVAVDRIARVLSADPREEARELAARALFEVNIESSRTALRLSAQLNSNDHIRALSLQFFNRAVSESCRADERGRPSAAGLVMTSFGWGGFLVNYVAIAVIAGVEGVWMMAIPIMGPFVIAGEEGDIFGFALVLEGLVQIASVMFGAAGIHRLRRDHREGHRRERTSAHLVPAPGGFVLSGLF